MNDVHQPPFWFKIYGSGDHATEFSRANPDSVNFVGNAQRDDDM